MVMGRHAPMVQERGGGAGVGRRGRVGGTGGGQARPPASGPQAGPRQTTTRGVHQRRRVAG